MSGEPLLTLRNLHKRFPIIGSKKVVRALNGVDLVVHRGQTLSLVGESGSGKTTVGRCIAGLIDPDDGEIVYDGLPMTRRRNIRSPELRSKIQMVFQEPTESLDPRMTVGASLAEPLAYLDMPRQERAQRMAETAKRIGLKPALLERYPSELSADILQRIGIGRAIITRPALIILDEPTSALDPTARAAIVDLLFQLQRELGTAYLFISHDLSTVRHLSHDVAVLYLGAVLEKGRAQDVFTLPRHPYSSVLLASALLPHPSLKPSSRLRLEGEIPSPIDLPPGCTLASRCPFAEAACHARMPPVEEVSPGHLARCINSARLVESANRLTQFDEFQALAQRVLGRRGRPKAEPRP